MTKGNRFRRVMRRRMRIGRWSLSVGAVSVAAILLISGGAVYARLGGGFGDTSSSVNLQKGLIGWWKLDGNALDSTPYSNNGTVFNGTMGADRKGKSPGAYSQTGTAGERITLPTTGPYTTLATNSFTVTCWIKSSSTSAQVYVSGASSSKGYRFGMSSGMPYGLIGDGTNYVESGIGTTAINDNVWHSLTITYTYSGSWSMTAYVDGISTGTVNAPAVTGSISNSLGVLGAMDANGTNRSINGTMDDARIYNRLLSADEIKALAKTYDGGVKAGSGEKSMVGWWKLDGNAKDATPYGNNGTITGATPTADRKGSANSAYSFNGTSYIAVPGASNLDVGNVITVSAWFYSTTNATYQPIVSKVVAGSTAGWEMANSTGNLRATLRGATVDLTGGTISLNQWHHAAFTYDGATLKLYLDGALTGSVGGSSTLNTTAELWIAKRSNGGNYFGGGYIDDVRTYGRVLSLADIKQQYQSYNSQINLNSSPTTNTTGGNINAGLVGYWLFNGNTRDATPYQHDGTLGGSPSYVADRAGRSGAALGIALSTQWMDNVNVDIGNDWSASVWSPYPNNGLEESTHYRTLLRGNGGDHQVIVQTGSFALGTYDNTGGTNFHACTPAFNVNTLSSAWHNFVVTQAGGTTGTMIFYIDGVEKCRVNSYGSITDIRSIGNYWGGGQEWGTVDDVRIYNRALSAAEAAALYTSY